MTATRTSDMRYSRQRWLLTLCGLLLYLGDICTDTALAVRYFQETQYVWSGMTALFIITGLTVNQVFSYAWFLEKMEEDKEDDEKGQYLALHAFGMGILVRYYHLLKDGNKEIQRQNSSEELNIQELIWKATDLSMLKLFETFLESAPQLLLQLYIHHSHHEWSILQYLSLAFSFFNLAWSLVDYRWLLHKSLLREKKFSLGATLVYLLYKLFTITSLTLSYSLLLLLNVYCTVGLILIWVLGTIWAYLLRTKFCKPRVLEPLYRGVIGAILVFSFFNAKGKNTKREMFLYYLICTIINFSTPLIFFLSKPEFMEIKLFWAVSGLIYGGSFLGNVSLLLYYSFLSRQENNFDEVDGVKKETQSALRLKAFIQL
ncbi:PREDICTED: XK-related protein 9 [Cyprinodon variegatus]|uniref:XK-related protein n=1 Tax=Cyprinodon variegatus TaxID=28743 RepID=A0A3Q2DMN9_CYPVA|nr:PREDICTED: XK-related protein 9 [Cyprinodon variegatus]XP_015243593.1 PREDICTED: XK-related protein 9 [Cyprinodon variegatus]XP_015243594.1 PREDICTED: XK-related protein 9 [Cyprinodon variegatus]